MTIFSSFRLAAARSTIFWSMVPPVTSLRHNVNYIILKLQCCRSVMFTPDQGSWLLSIPDPKSRISDPGSRIQKQQRKRRGNFFSYFSYHFFVATNIIKLKIIFIFGQVKTFISPNNRNCSTYYTKNLCHYGMLSKIWVWDPGPQIQRQKGNGSRIRIRYTEKNKNMTKRTKKQATFKK